jgi:hypothetical protein
MLNTEHVKNAQESSKMKICVRFLRHLGWWLSCFMVISLLPSHVAGQTTPSLTRVSGVMYRADGAAAQGDLIITWPAFTTADQGAVQAGKKVATLDAGGHIDLGLFPTVGAVPSGTVYKVVLKASDGTTAVEYWNVPALPTATVSAIRVNTPSALAGSSSVTLQTAISGKLGRQGDTPVTMAGIRFASEFQGTTPSDKINSAVSDCKDTQCVVIVPSGMAAGMPSKIGDNTKIIDFRGNGTYRKDIGIFSRWTKVDSGLQLVDNLHLSTDAYRGGVNEWPTGAATKTQYASLWLTGRYRTIGERKDITEDVWCLGKGDCTGISSFIRDFGGYQTGGDESNEGARIDAEQGMSTGTDGFPWGTVTAVAGSKVTATWTHPDYLGEQRPVINTSRSVYSTGTLSSANGSNTPCTITGSGTSWNTLGTGAHSDLFLEIVPLSSGSLKYVVPITSITDATHLVIEYKQKELDATCIGLGLPAGAAYNIFYGGVVSSLDDPPAGASDPSAVNLAGTASMFQVGDSIQQPIGYNSNTTGIAVYTNRRIGPDNNGSVIGNFYNQGKRIESGLRVWGKYNYGLFFNAMDPAASFTTIQRIYPAGNLRLVQIDSNTAGSWVQLYAMPNAAGDYRYLTYDRSADSFTLSGTTTNPAWIVNGNIGAGGSSPSARMFAQTASGDATSSALVGNLTNGASTGAALAAQSNGQNKFAVYANRMVVNSGLPLRGYSGVESGETWTVDSSNGQAWFAKVCYNSAKTVCDYAGTGAPTGSCGTGSTYRRTDGGTNSTFYVCENSSWAAK